MACQHLTEKTGEISTEERPYMSVEWKVKVPGDLTFPQVTMHSIHSPSFHFKGATWNLSLMVVQKLSDTSVRTVDSLYLQLAKKNPAATAFRVNYNIGAKTVSGDAYQTDRGEMLSFKNSDCCGLFALSRCDLYHANLVSNGVVTFFCYFWVETVVNLDADPPTFQIPQRFLPSKELFQDNQLKIITSEHVTENIGEISTETPLLTYVEWKVPGKHLVSQVMKYTIDSPRFQFRNATWFLQMDQYSTVRGPCRRINLHLVETDCAAANFRVRCSVGIKTVDGKTHLIKQSEYDFHKNEGNQVWNAVLDGIVVTPNSLVTFFCNFLVENSRSLDVVSTAKMSEGHAGIPTAVMSSSNFHNPYASGFNPALNTALNPALNTAVNQYSPGLEKLGTNLKN